MAEGEDERCRASDQWVDNEIIVELHVRGHGWILVAA